MLVRALQGTWGGRSLLGACWIWRAATRVSKAWILLHKTEYVSAERQADGREREVCVAR